MLKDVRQLGCVLQDTEPPESLSIHGRARKSWDQFDKYDSQKLRSVMQTSEKTKVRRTEKFKSKVPHQHSPYAMKFEDGSQEEIERQERCARGDVWRVAKHILKRKETYKATFFSPTHSNPPFDQTINGTSADFILWRDYPLRRSTKSVLRFICRSTLSYKST